MFKFTIRDLLWLTVVVALGVAWWVDRVRMADRFSERDRAWRESVDKSLSEISTRTGQAAWIEMPDGELWSVAPIKEISSHENPATPPNSPSD
jgi:hypothetical protein